MYLQPRNLKTQIETLFANGKSDQQIVAELGARPTYVCQVLKALRRPDLHTVDPECHALHLRAVLDADPRGFSWKARA